MEHQTGNSLANYWEPQTVMTMATWKGEMLDKKTGLLMVLHLVTLMVLETAVQLVHRLDRLKAYLTERQMACHSEAQSDKR